MTRNTILVAILALAAGFVACTGQKSDPDKFRKGWALAWEDDFDGKTGLDAWSKIPRGKQPLSRHMSDNEALYVLEDGLLVLRGVENVADGAEIPFLTGGIRRQGVKKNSLGRVEVRARMNPVAGAVPFISLLPSDGTANIAIDIMERYGHDEFIYQSITSRYTTTEGMPDNPPSSALVGVNPNQFHTYGVETYPDSIVFFVDNNRTKKYPRILTDMPGQFPFNDMDLDLFIGIRLNKDADSTELPVDMFIDWVRYYEPETNN
ncbi:family 16 glycosylhydrolase [Proteiniphilum sp. X52]|uniref:glycoside hydrolase family 16 protein n=1 Tax=Proteiniphilum sp. X52 TaxID=2382159 RepID=UPI000F0A3854|nr:glycoside hydrolase family 16 protein [Proteiniphilum sp. X52]RNC65343.1 glycoside hydrolase family 16 protein [Proteiniphilum sp. X52]